MYYDATEEENKGITASFLDAYCRQYIHSSAQRPRFGEVLARMAKEEQGRRLRAAIETLH